MTKFDESPDEEFSISKPKQLVQLELLSIQQQNAMTKQEQVERIEEAAYALANTYHNERGGNFDECVEEVSTVLETTGAGMDSTFGALIVAESQPFATKACRVVFPVDDSVEY